MGALWVVRTPRSPLVAAVALTGMLCACVSKPASSTPDLLAFEPGEALAAGPQRAIKLDLTSPIRVICAYPGGREVLDRELPGLTARPEYGFFKEMTLVQLRPLSRGRISVVDLARVSAELAKLQAATAGSHPPKTVAARD